ncbi:MAG: DUF2505 domain-containing protein [Myxococcota bacterium]
MELSITHEFDCDVERYWRTFFDEEYNRALYRELKMRDRTVLEHVSEGGGETIRRVVRVVPDVELPSLVRKIVGESVAYVERSTWSRARSALDVTVELDAPGMRDRFELRGVYAVAPSGPGRVRRDFHAVLSVRVPIVGGQVEKQIAEQTRKSYETTAVFTRRWLAEHPAEP